ncbi:hypothetical protein PM8797T_06877 [Gimesia maris DSM 8797]|uniref:DUF1501 domain-containing protein n=2 Tax=Gimesia maris TaxID=122 RepID=A0ABX5YG32_9PLAN|nr:hypothetical protein PM8797T_06877 [Gimesia maris DSM 8797]QDU12688.1 hypothetical protein CA11_04680 [Gimesia maris]QEG14625.1 hypothetical protein GmarT_04610 [Gimesia maris]
MLYQKTDQSESVSGSHSMSRREFFSWARTGLAGTALMDLLLHQKSGGASESVRQTSPAPHFPPRVKRVVHICLIGGLSHLDSFDYKPALKDLHGKAMPTDKTPETFFGKVGLLRKNDFEFRRRGQSGLWISDLFPHIAAQADELTLLRSMKADSANHTPATFQENTGFRLNGFPVLGSWLSYGLGCETDELPSFVVLPDVRGYPAAGTINWSNGFLPALHQGVPFQSQGPAIRDLFPERKISKTTEQASRRLLNQFNQGHLERMGANSDLEARIRSHELAAKMQLAVPRVTDLSAETPATQSLYGFDSEVTAPFARNCLLARRLLEQGVRFVQLFSGGPFGSPRINWDGHENVKGNHLREAARIDQPVAALVQDLRQRGMLDDTLVLFSTEFGRTPFTQSASDQVGTGRDHNMNGFSVWMAGGGLKHGFSYGATDEFGWKSVEKPIAWHDYHATVLHLLGIDHTRLTWYHNGIERRLTNVHGEVIHEILA